MYGELATAELVDNKTKRAGFVSEASPVVSGFIRQLSALVRQAVTNAKRTSSSPVQLTASHF